MAGERLSAYDWKARLEAAFQSQEPFIGHPLAPIPLLKTPKRTEKVVSYVELELVMFFEQYAARMGGGSVSEVVRRLAIIGAMAEGYAFDEEQQPGE